MARKNVFGIEQGDLPSSLDVQHERPLAELRPLAGFEKPLKRASPVGAISQSLGGINERAQRVEDLEKQLAKGQAVVELDPELIDVSFVSDRLGVSQDDQDLLEAQIREHGQQVPILVRPHPTSDGRYQVAYGHRRLAAVRQIGGTIKAVVRDLSDEQLVVSQGQENNARTDLSFIERSFFASRLEQREFSRDVIMSALGVDKAALSRMIALVTRLPGTLIEAVGPAPGFGRTRWADIADLMEDKPKHQAALKLIEEPAFKNFSSDDRFLAVYNCLKQVPEPARKSVWKDGSGEKAVRVSENGERLSIVFDKRVAADFGSFVEHKLDELYAEFQQSQASGG
ncbi:MULTISPECIES: plasmid partitioning protein RepB [unclassified Ensifer]|uniref:plasmid partitioning protein RepB n=1 Tax=Ensifer TaxID=106591 RepID=UPI00070BC704|nr:MULTISPECIES: plasmid partitioning protein RepB [unclassified Ensifer]KQW34975.1 plasmid partitioning protein RepB [Ensifer sp. Root1252]KQY70298.1 plasmid partitioning protein RepB [Ensifer sp. Root142]KRC57299.1 plasmid partitioning protein RepB [Ensifer sp. Root231]KRC87795.1 plasmid partitioning protein RepB [Ensifer sp. Root258]